MATICQVLEFSVSAMLLDKTSGFNWKLIVLYGLPYEGGKQAFIDELHCGIECWRMPTLIGGDFNFIKFSSDKSNHVINYIWADALIRLASGLC